MNNRPTAKQWAALRVAVFTRDGRACSYCEAEDKKAAVDHVVPLSRGGSNDLDNLVVACRSCNTKKKRRTPEEWRSGIKVRGVLGAATKFKGVERVSEVTKREKGVFILEKIVPIKVRNKILGSGLTVGQVCEQAGISKSTASKFFNGKSSMKLSNYNKIVDAFDALVGSDE